VKRCELAELVILGDISHYSYQSGVSAHMEEDRYLAVFCRAKGISQLNELHILDSYKDVSPVRS
jgi:hypothetical protein